LSARRRSIPGPFLALAQFIIAVAAAAAYLLGHGVLGPALFAASLTLLALTDRYRFRNVASVTLSAVNPRMLLLILAQLGGEVVVRVRLLIRGRSSTHDHRTSYALPFEGRWLVAIGGRSWRTSHSWHLIGQRYAYDFVAVDGQGHRHRATGRLREDYLSYGQPVLAPANGVVAHVRDGVRDAVQVGTGWVDWRSRDFRGNFVVIRHAEAEYSLLAHLVPGSIALRAGDQVQRGQRVGLCGHSGHSTEPHLHFQVQDRENFFLAASLPVAFTNTVVNGDKQTGPVHLSIGDLVERAQ
jgi:murein DD-endopeptidase MepM/ murein hydrolase activator NlpD